ncbi:MAG TPA: hypothetical protein VHY84_25260 [Bryobacteraceae bacterium]|jgi:hypothetical protein|nr:hypothetical protein [Bryobacteraceae bacterium]
MPIGRTELNALRNLISEADLILETTPPLPQNRTGAARENLKAALALTDDLIGQTRLNAASILGRKGGAAAARKLGSDHFRKMARKQG